MKIKPTLIINGDTGIDDLIDLFEDGVSELYSASAILNYLSNNGLEEVALKFICDNLL